MDINRFVQRRKELGLSQVKLAHEICTQSTLSKFENNGQIPSLNILQQLCNRLGLSVDELSQDDEDSIVFLSRQLKQAEINIMIGDLTEARECLQRCSINPQSALPHQMQFYLIRGMVDLLVDQNHQQAMTDFKFVAEDLDQGQQTIWFYLAQTGQAMVYDQEARESAAKGRFKLVATYVDDLKDLAIEKIADYEYVLAISYILGRYFWQSRLYKSATDYIDFGLRLAEYHHVSYFVPRLYMIKAEILKSQHADQFTIQEFIQKAAVFADFNHNLVVQKWVQAQAEGEEYGTY